MRCAVRRRLMNLTRRWCEHDMLNESTLKTIATQLYELAEGVQRTAIEASHQLSIPLDAIREDNRAALQESLKALCTGKGRHIYRFSVAREVSEPLHKAFFEAKAAKKNNRAYCRMNEASELLYVGSSSSLHSRIQQHLGFGSHGTYAMQLLHWLPPVEGELNIEVWRFGPAVDGAVLQAIEDGLWAMNKPMFGRQGAR